MRLKKGQTNSGSFKKGQVPWNKGLTKETDARVKKYGISGSITKRRLFKEGILISTVCEFSSSRFISNKLTYSSSTPTPPHAGIAPGIDRLLMVL